MRVVSADIQSVDNVDKSVTSKSPCKEGLRWFLNMRRRGASERDVWEQCPRGDWLLWWLAHYKQAAPTIEQIIRTYTDIEPDHFHNLFEFADYIEEKAEGVTEKLGTRLYFQTWATIVRHHFSFEDIEGWVRNERSGDSDSSRQDTPFVG